MGRLFCPIPFESNTWCPMNVVWSIELDDFHECHTERMSYPRDQIPINVQMDQHTQLWRVNLDANRALWLELLC